ncbi:MAG: hypothetical protein KDA51_03450 [Planctomycetales bacterium]|nr:hypothetical protein [Planctomycetales bacterium]MCB0344877.1 hypothetical protein [Bdellovibrionales bacterium]
MGTEPINSLANHTTEFAGAVLAEASVPGARGVGSTAAGATAFFDSVQYLNAVDHDLTSGDARLSGSMKWLLAEAGKTSVLAGIGLGAAALIGAPISVPAAIGVAGLTVAGVDATGLARGAWDMLDRGVHSVTDRFVDFFEPSNLRSIRNGLFSWW